MPFCLECHHMARHCEHGVKQPRPKALRVVNPDCPTLEAILKKAKEDWSDFDVACWKQWLNAPKKDA